jgi:Gpi18-like mannosyltransferase
MKKIQRLILLALISIIPSIFVWIPFFARLKSLWGIPLPQAGMATIVSNYDGPIYLVIAKSLYNTEFIKWNFQFPLPIEYYAAHFPLFPFLIRMFSLFLGFPYAMLFVTIAASVLATYFFYKFIRQYHDERNSFFLTLVFSLFPARWLIVKSVGSAEPLFIAGLVASIYYFQNKKYLLAGVWGALAQFAKPPGILLFVAYILTIFVPMIKNAITSNKNMLKWVEIRKYWPILLIPLALILVFSLFGLQFKNFWAYFNSGDNIHLMFPPFSIFNYSAPWVGTFWLEEVIFVYLLGILGVLKLIKDKDSVVSWFTGIFILSILFVAHRDILRYALPAVPFIIKAYSNTLVTKEFKIAFAIIIIPIFLFSLSYISQNTMPISNWAPFL